MCPSYLATNEEMHSTRGRARLLFEMLRGDAITDGFASEAVEEALDLCLGCKGCKHDCPVEVDMATYKAEFRAHHYAWRPRPRAAYSMGLIRGWARLGSRMPGIANRLVQAPILGGAAKALAGIAPARTIPPFAAQTFTDWFRTREAPGHDGKRVLLWPDTFNNYFRPQTAIAATQALEAMGYRVDIPRVPVCCGRPLYDWGWLGAAKRLWGRTLDCLRDDIRSATPLVGLEPACVAAFRDELPNLLAGDARAQRLSDQTVFFSDFVADRLDGLALPPNWQKALVQIHCHHHAVIKRAGEQALLDRLGLDYQILPSGCCGMAGAFGFESAKYDISMAIAERVLLPTVRAADPDVFIVSDGFSCREQIEQATGRHTLHAAELVAQRLAN
jgi:Fe-S oxidoreductase